MEQIADIVDSLEQGLEHITDARSDSRYVEGIDGIVMYEELDRLALLIKLSIERVHQMSRK